jgi:hypothetical protein
MPMIGSGAFASDRGVTGGSRPFASDSEESPGRIRSNREFTFENRPDGASAWARLWFRPFGSSQSAKSVPDIHRHCLFLKADRLACIPREMRDRMRGRDGGQTPGILLAGPCPPRLRFSAAGGTRGRESIRNSTINHRFHPIVSNLTGSRADGRASCSSSTRPGNQEDFANAVKRSI